jgi:hypothetical protein
MDRANYRDYGSNETATDERDSHQAEITVNRGSRLGTRSI